MLLVQAANCVEELVNVGRVLCVSFCCCSQHLPLVVDLEAFRPAGDAGEGVQLVLPEHCPAAGFTKRDVHGDLGLVVICLDKSG